MTKRLTEAIAVLRDLPDTVQDAAAEVLFRYITERHQLESESARADEML